MMSVRGSEPKEWKISQLTEHQRVAEAEAGSQSEGLLVLCHQASTSVLDLLEKESKALDRVLGFSIVSMTDSESQKQTAKRWTADERKGALQAI